MLQAGRGESEFDEDNYQPPAMHVNLSTVSPDSDSSLTAQLRLTSLPKDGEAADPMLHKASILSIMHLPNLTPILSLHPHTDICRSSLRTQYLVQVLYRWAVSERLKLLLVMVNGRGDDVAATLNPQAGEVQCSTEQQGCRACTRQG